MFPLCVWYPSYPWSSAHGSNPWHDMTWHYITLHYTTWFWQKQMSSLCGQHCINNLVQGAHYSAPDLAEIAHELDAQERAHMLSEGANTPDALRWGEMKLGQDSAVHSQSLSNERFPCFSQGRNEATLSRSTARATGMLPPCNLHFFLPVVPVLSNVQSHGPRRKQFAAGSWPPRYDVHADSFLRLLGHRVEIVPKLPSLW